MRNIKLWLSILVTLSLTGCLETDGEYASDNIINALASSEKEMPATIHETHLLQAGTTQPHIAQVPYDVKVPLWTDGAKKERYVFIPPNSKVELNNGRYAFPLGSTFTKHFTTEAGEPVETRVMTLKDDNKWYFATYVWEGGVAKKNEFPSTIQGPDGQDYRIPSEKECQTCHKPEALDPPVIGFQPDQMGVGQQEILAELNKRNLTDLNYIEDSSIPDPTDDSLDLETRVRAYLHANCASCHRPNGAAAEDENIDLRFDRTFEETLLVSEKKIVPGNLEDSVLWQKFIATEERMPPLSIRRDPLGENLIKSWILSLE